jgi:hypothetical protein
MEKILHTRVLKNCDFEQFLKFQGSKITNQKKSFTVKSNV